MFSVIRPVSYMQESIWRILSLICCSDIFNCIYPFFVLLLWFLNSVNFYILLVFSWLGLYKTVWVQTEPEKRSEEKSGRLRLILNLKSDILFYICFLCKWEIIKLSRVFILPLVSVVLWTWRVSLLLMEQIISFTWTEELHRFNSMCLNYMTHKSRSLIKHKLNTLHQSDRSTPERSNSKKLYSHFKALKYKM